MTVAQIEIGAEFLTGMYSVVPSRSWLYSMLPPNAPDSRELGTTPSPGATAMTPRNGRSGIRSPASDAGGDCQSRDTGRRIEHPLVVDLRRLPIDGVPASIALSMIDVPLNAQPRLRRTRCRRTISMSPGTAPST